MKKLLLASGMLVVLITSCTQKVPVAENSISLNEKLEQGKVIYENACANCHSLPVPTNFTPVEWVGLMNSMAPRSKLTDEQHQLVYDYVISVKK